MGKMTKRAKQAILTKNKLYECGVKLIREHGFDEVTIEQIAQEAGVSVGTYYYYFESKMDLFKEIFKRADDYFMNDVESHFETNNSKDQIIEYFDKYALFSITDGIALIKKLYTAENKLFTAEGRGMQSVLTNIIKEGQSNNLIHSDMTPEELTKILFVVARGVIFDWCLYDGNTDLQKEMKTVIQMMVKGF